MEILIPIVNENDEIIGHDEKLKVHEMGHLHRAFSILVFNDKNEILLQQRAFEKYHSPGLWTNTCCGHPNKDEKMEVAIHRRLQEEMGFDCLLDFNFKFHYQAKFSNGLTENEIDHVYIGTYNSDIKPEPSEVAAYKWIKINDLLNEVKNKPEDYTVWFKIILENDDFKALVKD